MGLHIENLNQSSRGSVSSMNLAIKIWVRGTLSCLLGDIVVDEKFTGGTIGGANGNGS